MGMMKVQERGTKNGSARRHVRRQFSTNHRERHLGRDSIGNVLSVTFTSPDRERTGPRVVTHELKALVVAVGLQVRRERKKVRVSGLRGR
jgi:hypothetical protein